MEIHVSSVKIFLQKLHVLLTKEGFNKSVILYAFLQAPIMGVQLEQFLYTRKFPAMGNISKFRIWELSKRVWQLICWITKFGLNCFIVLLRGGIFNTSSPILYHSGEFKSITLTKINESKHFSSVFNNDHPSHHGFSSWPSMNHRYLPMIMKWFSTCRTHESWMEVQDL